MGKHIRINKSKLKFAIEELTELTADIFFWILLTIILAGLGLL